MPRIGSTRPTTSSRPATPSSGSRPRSSTRGKPKDGVDGAQIPWTERVGRRPKAGADVFVPKGRAKPTAGQRLAPFESYYPASTTVPKLKAGETLRRFDTPQVQALHRAYWSAPPDADLDAMIDIAVKDPAFKGVERPSLPRVGSVIRAFPKSFPWGWRSRGLTASSHALVDALMMAPRGTQYKEVIAALKQRFPDFAHLGMKKASMEMWQQEPDRFPFVGGLDRREGAPGYKLHSVGQLRGFLMHRGRLAQTRELADKIIELSSDPRIGWDWSHDDFLQLCAEEIGPGWSSSTYRNMRTVFPDIPDFQDMRARVSRRVAERANAILQEGGVSNLDELADVMQQRHGYDASMDRNTLHYLRTRYPELITNFKADVGEQRDQQALELVTAIQLSPGVPYETVGDAMGFDKNMVKFLLERVRLKHPDLLPAQQRITSPKAYKFLRELVADAPIDFEVEHIWETLEAQHPEFLAEFPMGGPGTLYQVLVRAHGGESIADLRQRRYAEAFAGLVKSLKTVPTFTDLVHQMQDEVPGSYGLSNALKQQRLWEKHPKRFGAIAKLRNRDGSWPWSASRLKLDKALAQRAAQALEKHHGEALAVIAAKLKRDPKFKKRYPNFSAKTFGHLRERYPQIVPYADDLSTGNRGRLLRKQATERTKLAKRVAKYVGGLESPRGLTAAGIARKLKVQPHKVTAALRSNPELFPWYRQRPAGEIDLHLASRVAVAMEQASVGVELSEIIAELKSDKAFTERYPAFNYHSIGALRERYPELIPHWFNRNQILKSSLIADAVRRAPKGQSFKQIISKLKRQRPGVFAGDYTNEADLIRMWDRDPERFAFTDDLRQRGKLKLVGRGQDLPIEGDAAVSQRATQLARLKQIPTALPLLDKLVDKFAKNTFDDFEVIAVQHILDSQVPTFDAYRKLGIKPSRTSVVAVPYSSSQGVVDTLDDQGWDVTVPPLDMKLWHEDIRQALHKRLASALKSGRHIIALDDGGLVSKLIEEDPLLQEHAHLFRVVEQTRRGITVADALNPSVPVINVAQSWGKYVEGPMIASSVEDKLIARLARLGVDKLKGKRVGVIGYGTIGKPIADALAELGAKVTVLDVDDKAVKRAKRDGHKAARSRATFFGGADIIVGASGVRSMNAEDLAHLKPGAIIGSASSKLVEIDVDGLEDLAKKSKGKAKFELVDTDSHPPTARYTLKDGRTVDLLAKGFPVNFDGGVENIEPEKIQLTRALMLIGAVQATGAMVRGINRLDADLQIDVLEKFESGATPDSLDEEQREVLSVAQARLRAAKENRSAHYRRRG